MPGILRNIPRVAMVFAALTLLLAALAVSLPSLGFAKSAPEAAVSFNEGGGNQFVDYQTVTINENTLAKIHGFRYTPAPGGVHDQFEYSLAGEDADDFYIHQYHGNGTYFGDIYNSRVFDFEDEDDKILEFTFVARFERHNGFVYDHTVYYTVIVKEQPEPTPTEKPGEPQNLSVVPGDGSLTATWDSPADGGAASGYNVEYRAAGAGNEWVRIISNGGATGVEITGLERSGYLVRVQAVNEIGASSWARQRTSEPGIAQKPGEPQNLSLVPGDGSLTATWDPPADGGTASGYTVDYRPAGGSNRWSRVVYNHAATSIELTGLEPGVYLVRVRAINEIGASGWARQRTSKPAPPEPAEAPGRPQNLSVAPGSGSLTVTWDPPVSGGAASGYNVDYRFAGGGNRWVSVLSNADVTSVEITGLEPDRYVVRVKAVNKIGESRRALKRVEVRP